MENKENQDQNNPGQGGGDANQGPQQGQGTQPQQQQAQQGGVPPNANLPSVPNATAVLVLGILSIIFCWCYGIVGAVLGIIALVLAKKGSEAYKANPNAFSVSSYNNLKAGKICGIIGISLSGLILIYYIIVIAFYGAVVTSMPWEEILNQSSY